MPYNWNNKVVLLTGASSGIGRALAVAIGAKGARVGLLARRADELEAVAQEVGAAGGQALVLPSDVTDADAVKAAAEQLRKAFGQIDILIANAGVGGITDGRVVNVHDFGRVISINLLGAVNSISAVVQEMVAQGSGHIVAVSSLAGYRGLPKSGAYCGSKAGLSAMCESLRLDLRGSGVDVTIVHPGFIKTPLTSGREAQMPWLLELDDGIGRILQGIEQRKASFAFPWQLATIVRLGMFFPTAIYDWVAARNSFRE